ncbi:hypothetical protein BBJ28_00009657 [Nothophytophthora sp. Chile5]|nr:hypothetical protein BBJ28_00009657 [Nothophytophthora sp. Chile5]
MFISAEAATQVLQPLGERPVNLIAIFGAARQGKSFLMNLLADQQDLFKISNLREPCTQGVDLSGHFLPLDQFSALNGCPPLATKASRELHIGFVDAEGQGDRDITVFRDWSFVDSTPEEVYKDLFQKEKGRSEEVNVRNLARVNLIEAFESINIWLFPAPVANTANLRDKIRFDQLQRPFQNKLRELRKCLSSQLQQPMTFYRQPLTAKFLSQMMPALVDTLNSDQVIMPESIYSSMVRAEAVAAKESCEKAIASYCEAAGLEEMISSEEFEKMLQQDIELIIQEAYEKMKTFPATVRKEMQTSLRAFAEKEITLALHANSEKIAAELSKEVDAVFESLKTECLVIEQTLLPMKSALLRQKCTDLLTQELRRLEALPLGLQGKRGVEIECGRVRQTASLLFDKLDVVNDKAIQQSTAVLNDHLRAAKARMTKELHASLDKKFTQKRPVTITRLQTELDDLFAKVTREVAQQGGDVGDFATSDFRSDLEHHKTQLADEMNRRYMIEMRQILNEVGFSAREDLGKQVTYRLDGKMPMLEEEIKAAIDSAIAQVKKAVADQLQGWTVLKSDLEAKSIELEKLGDVFADDYLRRNQQLEKDVGARKENEQYEQLRVQLTETFERELHSLGFPTTDDKIVSVFHKVLQKLVASFLTDTAHPATSSFTVKGLRENLTSDCKPALESQKMLNRLSIEKKQALDLAEKERRMRERERLAAEQKEVQITELKSYVTKSLGEKDSESKRLRDQLLGEERKARQLEQQVQEMKLQSAALEKQKQEMALREKEQLLREAKTQQDEAARLKQQLAEMRRKTVEGETQRQQLELQIRSESRQKEEAEELKRQLEEMKFKAGEMEIKRIELELIAQEAQARREEAESAARAAAAAAALSARAALEAAEQEVTPVKTPEADGRKRKRLSRSGSEDVEMEDVSRPPPPRPKPSSTSGSERKKPRGPDKNRAAHAKSGKKMSLAEARKAAQEEVEKRIQARTKALSSASKKKK